MRRWTLWSWSHSFKLFLRPKSMHRGNWWSEWISMKTTSCLTLGCIFLEHLACVSLSKTTFHDAWKSLFMLYGFTFWQIWLCLVLDVVLAMDNFTHCPSEIIIVHLRWSLYIVFLDKVWILNLSCFVDRFERTNLWWIFHLLWWWDYFAESFCWLFVFRIFYWYRVLWIIETVFILNRIRSRYEVHVWLLIQLLRVIKGYRNSLLRNIWRMVLWMISRSGSCILQIFGTLSLRIQILLFSFSLKLYLLFDLIRCDFIDTVYHIDPLFYYGLFFFDHKLYLLFHIILV